MELGNCPPTDPRASRQHGSRNADRQQGSGNSDRVKNYTALQSALVYPPIGGFSTLPTGFIPPPKITFSRTSSLPVANTCGNTLTLPLAMWDYAAFKYYMCIGITNAVGFGSV